MVAALNAPKDGHRRNRPALPHHGKLLVVDALANRQRHELAIDECETQYRITDDVVRIGLNYKFYEGISRPNPKSVRGNSPGLVPCEHFRLPCLVLVASEVGVGHGLSVRVRHYERLTHRSRSRDGSRQDGTAMSRRPRPHPTSKPRGSGRSAAAKLGDTVLTTQWSGSPECADLNGTCRYCGNDAFVRAKRVGKCEFNFSAAATHSDRVGGSTRAFML